MQESILLEKENRNEQLQSAYGSKYEWNLEQKKKIVHPILF